MLRNLSIRAAVTTRRLAGRLVEEARQRPDRGDISITTAIIWIAGTAAAVGMAGAIAFIVAKYADNLRGS